MDPLSLSASIAGLLGAAAQVIKLLGYISSVKNAPTAVQEAETEVKHIEIALRGIQEYLTSMDPLYQRRAGFIRLDDLIATLSDAMIVFDEFYGLLQQLARSATVMVRIIWFRYSKQIEERISKIQRHKSSLSLMLNILQCESDREASRSQGELQAMVQSILYENRSLRSKMSQLQDSFDAQSTFRWPNGEEPSSKYTSIRTPSIAPERVILLSGQSTFRFTFEPTLESTWVYRRNELNECDASFISTAQRSHAWSIFSGYSLANISILSVIAMPISTNNLVHRKFYEDPGDTSTVQSSTEFLSSATRDSRDSTPAEAETKVCRESDLERAYGDYASRIEGILCEECPEAMAKRGHIIKLVKLHDAERIPDESSKLSLKKLNPTLSEATTLLD
ncbi:hypothetical protein JX266_000839 [Neoarthrinium moseri]|nr:hypothetical protein JX266_000839 [Neoarthrinium moseri]